MLGATAACLQHCPLRVFFVSQTWVQALQAVQVKAEGMAPICRGSIHAARQQVLCLLLRDIKHDRCQSVCCWPCAAAASCSWGGSPSPCGISGACLWLVRCCVQVACDSCLVWQLCCCKLVRRGAPSSEKESVILLQGRKLAKVAAQPCTMFLLNMQAHNLWYSEVAPVWLEVKP